MIPLIAGHVLWPLTERLLGRDTIARLSELRASDLAGRGTITAIQTDKLRRLLSTVGAHLPWYAERLRSAGIDPKGPNLGLDGLAKLPLLERADIRDHLGEMTWKDCPGSPAKLYNTGGSSGEPLKFYLDRCRQAADWAARWRARQWWGVQPGDREIMVWAAPGQTRQDRLRTLRDRLLNQHVLNAFDMSRATMGQYLVDMRRLAPTCLYGYASSIALLARHALATCGAMRIPSLRVIFTTGEVLTEIDQRDIRDAFGVPVAIEYGSRDAGLLACGCPAGRLHVCEENVILEVLDPQGLPVQPGGVGEVVVTSLEAFATPFIRYRVGDLAVVPENSGAGSGQCACGRWSRQLIEIRGRVTDQIVCEQDGQIRRMHALSLIYVLREAEGLHQFRITQDSLHHLGVEVVADARFTAAVQQNVVQGLRRRMGPRVAIDIQRRERIAPSASGKHACVVSRIANELP